MFSSLLFLSLLSSLFSLLSSLFSLFPSLAGLVRVEAQSLDNNHEGDYYTHFEARHVIFQDGQATFGGAICQRSMFADWGTSKSKNEASVSLIDSTFRHNTAMVGGAIWVETWNDADTDAETNEKVWGLKLDNTTFDNNLAYEDAGGIMMGARSKVTFVNVGVEFKNNYAFGSGNSLKALSESKQPVKFKFEGGCLPGSKGAINGELTVDDDFVGCPSLCKAGRYSNQCMASWLDGTFLPEINSGGYKMSDICVDSYDVRTSAGT